MVYPATTDWGSFDWSAATSEQKAARPLAEEYAWALLNRLSARTIGISPVALRPNRFGHRRPLTWSPAWAYGPLNPYQADSLPWGGDCACGERTQLWLPFDVGAIESVVIGGVTLPTSAYRVDNGNILVRQDGQPWPAHQDMSKPAGEPDTFVVTMYTGVPPTSLDNFAAGVLAREFLKLVTGEKGCRLPAGTQTIQKQGVTVIIDPAVRRGMTTNIPEVDNVIKLRNPHGLTQQSRVYSPDTIGLVHTSTGFNVPDEPGGGDMFIPDPNNPGYYILRRA